MFYEDAESAIIRDAFDLGNGTDKNTQAVLNESVFRRYFVGMSCATLSRSRRKRHP